MTDRRGRPPSAHVRTDRLGLPFVHTRAGPTYVSPCCHACVTPPAGRQHVYCTACGEVVDPRLGGVPVPAAGEEDPDAMAERWMREASARLEARRGRTGGIPRQRGPGAES